jgi:hypothetical protein
MALNNKSLACEAFKTSELKGEINNAKLVKEICN